MEIAISGDSIITRRVSSIKNTRFKRAIQPFRDADVAFTHLETNLLDFDDPGVFPSAIAGGTWMRSPPYVAEELKWLGIDMVSHASNHALDYSYGGLRSTWAALEEAGIKYAGTGTTLGTARAPTYFESPEGRVGLVSMASSIQRWTRAGEQRPDMVGRPGNNPQRYYHKVTSDTMENLRTLGFDLGWWMTSPEPRALQINRPGLHNSVDRYVEGDENTTVPHKRDLEGNIRSIEDASVQADYVIGHLHTHEFKPSGDIRTPAAFIEITAKKCIDAGADVFVVQGSHSPLRGIEIYEDSPIFYDPGDVFRMADSIERLPSEFYHRWEHKLSVSPADATPSQGFRARRADSEPGATSGYTGEINPSVGYLEGSVMGHVIASCVFEDDTLSRIELHPGTFIENPKRIEMGVPVQPNDSLRREIIHDIAEKSKQYNTEIEYKDGRGILNL